MCLILFAHQADPRFPLVVAANRDEFYSRPTRHADFWQESGLSGSVLAGKDLLAGGTWLGISANGRFAAVTNIRDPSQLELKTRSRGELTLNFLKGDDTPAEYSEKMRYCFTEFAGYNLLLGDRESLFYLNNLEGIVEQLQPGFYGLSNSTLNSTWPKVTMGRERLQRVLNTEATPDTEQLISIMNDRERAPDEELPNTGIPIELERKLSSAFIQNPERQYGTLCSTAIITDANGVCRFSEQNYDDHGNSRSGHFYHFEFQS